MGEDNTEAKEIRLFGEKSIREEAYRQKILQLEREMARLEALARESQITNPKNETNTVHLEGLYHESLLSFDKRVKREQEFLEKRAAEISERIDLQAQRLLLDIETSFRHKIRLIFVAVFATGGILFFLFLSAFILYKAGMQISQPAQEKTYAGSDERLQKRISYIKTALQNQTIYRNQYEVRYVDLLDATYVVEIELNFPPADKWFLKNLISDVIAVFQKYANNSSAEFSFLHEGKLYSKAYLTGAPPKVRLQYFY